MLNIPFIIGSIATVSFTVNRYTDYFKPYIKFTKNIIKKNEFIGIIDVNKIIKIVESIMCKVISEAKEIDSMRDDYFFDRSKVETYLSKIDINFITVLKEELSEMTILLPEDVVVILKNSVLNTLEEIFKDETTIGGHPFSINELFYIEKIYKDFSEHAIKEINSFAEQHIEERVDFLLELGEIALGSLAVIGLGMSISGVNDNLSNSTNIDY